MQKLALVGAMKGLRVFEAVYPASWRTTDLRNELLPHWRKAKPGFFNQADSGFTGSRDLFAQTCLAYLLSEQGYRSTTFYKLAFDVTKARGKTATPADMVVRQDYIRAKIGPKAMEALRDALRATDLPLFKGEPDLFCWHPDRPDDWFFAEAKDVVSDDGLTFQQVRWMFTAQLVLGEQTDLRVYYLRPDQEPRRRRA